MYVQYQKCHKEIEEKKSDIANNQKFTVLEEKV